MESPMTLDMLIQAFEKGEQVKFKAMKGKDFKRLITLLRERNGANHD